MEMEEQVPCGVCGEGFLEVKSTVYGQWRVDEVLAACLVCGSDDIAKARAAPKQKTPPQK